MAAGRHKHGHDHLKSLQKQLRAAANFGEWLKTRGIGVRSVTWETAEDFIRRTCARAGWKPNSGSMGTFKAAVRRVVVLLGRPRRPRHRLPIPPKSHTRELAAFAEHLRRRRGVGEVTTGLYVRYVRPFLHHAFGAGPVRLKKLTSGDVERYVLDKLEHFLPQTVQSKVAGALRSYFAYKTLDNPTARPLLAAIPRLRLPRAGLSPSILTDEDLEKLWSAFDSRTPLGRLEYAIVRCLTDLGMRVGDVVCLRLDDLRWREGLIRVQNHKNMAPIWLPLPETVGNALADYLENSRPVTDSRRLFVYQRTLTSPSVCSVLAFLRNAYRRLGLYPRIRGAHILRHTAATRMRRAGVSLKEMADVLGHRSVRTTARYAQIDLPALRAVAQPWPGGRS